MRVSTTASHQALLYSMTGTTHRPALLCGLAEACGADCCCCAAGEDAAKWLTEFLGKPVRLVRYVGEHLQQPTSASKWQRTLAGSSH